MLAVDGTDWAEPRSKPMPMKAVPVGLGLAVQPRALGWQVMLVTCRTFTCAVATVLPEPFWILTLVSQ